MYIIINELNGTLLNYNVFYTEENAIEYLKESNLSFNIYSIKKLEIVDNPID